MSNARSDVDANAAAVAVSEALQGPAPERMPGARRCACRVERIDDRARVHVSFVGHPEAMLAAERKPKEIGYVDIADDGRWYAGTIIWGDVRAVARRVLEPLGFHLASI